MCIHDISELKNGHLVAKEFLHVGPFHSFDSNHSFDWSLELLGSSLQGHNKPTGVWYDTRTGAISPLPGKKQSLTKWSNPGEYLSFLLFFLYHMSIFISFGILVLVSICQILHGRRVRSTSKRDGSNNISYLNGEFNQLLNDYQFAHDIALPKNGHSATEKFLHVVATSFDLSLEPQGEVEGTCVRTLHLCRSYWSMTWKIAMSERCLVHPRMVI